MSTAGPSATSSSPEDGLLETLQATLAACSDTVTNWMALADLEARSAFARMLVCVGLAASAVLLAVATWLFMMAAGVAALIEAGWSPAIALLGAAGLNVVLLGLAVMLFWSLLRRPWFAASRRQLQFGTPLPEAGNVQIR